MTVQAPKPSATPAIAAPVTFSNEKHPSNISGTGGFSNIVMTSPANRAPSYSTRAPSYFTITVSRPVSSSPAYAPSSTPPGSTPSAAAPPKGNEEDDLLLDLDSADEFVVPDPPAAKPSLVQKLRDKGRGRYDGLHQKLPSRAQTVVHTLSEGVNRFRQERELNKRIRAADKKARAENAAAARENAAATPKQEVTKSYESAAKKEVTGRTRLGGATDFILTTGAGVLTSAVATHLVSTSILAIPFAFNIAFPVGGALIGLGVGAVAGGLVQVYRDSKIKEDNRPLLRQSFINGAINGFIGAGLGSGFAVGHIMTAGASAAQGTAASGLGAVGGCLATYYVNLKAERSGIVKKVSKALKLTPS